MRRVLFALLVAAPVAASAGQISVRLQQPLDQSTLRGGSTAVITWSADALGPGVEEWEAFLSVDGGKYYGARITPHLDVSIREFRWTVPNVDTSNARILLRFGDERRETAVELPQRFAIRSSPAAPHVAATVTRREAGEPARPGDPGVATWTDSDRHGRDVRRFQTESDAIRAVRHTDREQDELESTTDVAVRPDAVRGAAPADHRRPRFRCAPPVTAGPLLQSCRLNI